LFKLFIYYILNYLNHTYKCRPSPSTSASIPVRSQVRRNISTPPSTRQRKEASDPSYG